MLKLKHVLSTGAATLLSGGFSLMVAVLAARMLGPSENGHYAQYVIVLNLVWLGLNFGLGPATTYFVASTQLHERAVLRVNHRFLIAMTCLAAFGVALLHTFGFDSLLERELKIPATIGALGVAGGVALLALNQSTALQMGRHLYSRVNLLNMLRTGAPLPLIAIAGSVSPTATASAGAQTLALAVVAAWSWSQLRVAHISPTSTTWQDARAMLAYGGVAYLSNLLHYVAIRGLLLAFSYYATPADVGFINLALLLLEALLLLPSSIGQLLFPQSSGDSFNPRAVESILRLSTVFAVAVAVVIAFTAPEMSAMLLGDAYRPVGVALRHLTPSVVLLAIPRILSQVLSGLGHPRYPLYAALASVLVGAPVAVWVMPTWGLTGTAWVVNIVSLVTALVTMTGYIRVQRITWCELLVPSRSERASVRAALHRIFRRPA